MTLYVCWGLFRTPGPGHPCRNARDALLAAGHDPEVVRARGWGLLPAALNRTRGRREVRALTGNDWVPVLVDGDAVIQGSGPIVAWARAHPASDADRADALSTGSRAESPGVLAC